MSLHTLHSTRLFTRSASNAAKTMVKAKKYIFQKQFVGLPKASDFKLVEEELRPLKDGEFLTEAIYLSVDPYMRAYAYALPLGSTFIGSQVAKVIDSKNPKYAIGKYVVGDFGWRTHTIANDIPNPKALITTWMIPDFEGLPLSLALGVLGMPGNSAYFGFLEICKPKPGETVAISSAAGAVGSTVGQIAKIKDCKVIGIAGSDEKGKWLTEELKFDHFINYKDPDFKNKLVAAAPEGIDCYFDNVGGQLSTLVMNRMNMFGRVAVCGAISGYNDRKAAKADAAQFPVVSNQLKMEGFVITRWWDRWFEGIEQNKKWIKEGKLKYRETITVGFNNMVPALVDMLQGGNTGKAIVKIEKCHL